MEIPPNQTSTAIFTGRVDMQWLQRLPGQAKNWLKAKWLDVKALGRSLLGKIPSLKEKIKRGWDFLKGWYDDDPVGATAGVAAGVLTVGVLVFGGQALAATAGGVKLFGGIKSLLTVKGLMATVAVGAGVNAATGNPIQQAIRWVVRLTQTAYNFNWNISDQDILKKQQALMNNVIIQAGGALGTALGGLSCGAMAGVATISINVTLLADLFDVLNEDTQEEILEAFTALIYFAKVAAAQMFFLETYKNVRKWIKNNLKTGDAATDKKIQSWGAEGGKPWTMASKVEEYIETISNGNEVVQSTIEEFAENFMDSCTEALYAVT